MSVIDTLVYDRTQADVDRVFELKAIILSDYDAIYEIMTQEEYDEYIAGMKGAYNYKDMNRVGEAVQYIADRMIALPTALKEYREKLGVSADTQYDVPYDVSTVVVSTKTDWAIGDIPTLSQVTTYLNNLVVLRKQLTLPSNAPEVPVTLDYLTYTVANNIEYLLYLIDTKLTEVEQDLYSKIDRTANAFAYSGITYSGE